MIRELLTTYREEKAKAQRLKHLLNAEVDYKLLQELLDARPEGTEIVIREKSGTSIVLRRSLTDQNNDKRGYYR